MPTAASTSATAASRRTARLSTRASGQTHSRARCDRLVALYSNSYPAVPQAARDLQRALERSPSPLPSPPRRAETRGRYVTSPAYDPCGVRDRARHQSPRGEGSRIDRGSRSEHRIRRPEGVGRTDFDTKNRLDASAGEVARFTPGFDREGGSRRSRRSALPPLLECRGAWGQPRVTCVPVLSSASRLSRTASSTGFTK